ncbi:MAG: efflux RND transporter periplasmic adaptor subunit [Proteobacteria bacterium]|nr:efflux RND transporter periplasmic adaptor subunit [Pseudomonadota bacterium]
MIQALQTPLDRPALPRRSASAAETASLPGVGSADDASDARPWWRRPWLLVGAGGAIALAFGVTVLTLRPAAGPAYVTAPLKRADLVVTVAATGTLAPVDSAVDVGSEVSGTIVEAPVQENDRVRKGQVLARLDTSRLQDQVAQSEAALASARSSLELNQATLRENGLTRDRMHRLFDLSKGGWPARKDVDAADADYGRAEAQVSVAKAAILNAEATLRTNRTNLAKATIRSPVDGIVLARKIEPGQTVAASLQAPVLFTLAKDLEHMELDVDIDEADVGRVHAGQTSVFTVDAYAGREFSARLVRVDYGSQTKDGVVTYRGVLLVDNSDLSLRPGMTATATITTDSHRGALLAPNAALRFSPPAQPAKPRNQGILTSLTPRMPRRTGEARQPPSAGQAVWVLRGGRAVRVPVRAGLSDGQSTELLDSGGLAPGAPVLTDVRGR